MRRTLSAKNHHPSDAANTHVTQLVHWGLLGDANGLNHSTCERENTQPKHLHTRSQANTCGLKLTIKAPKAPIMAHPQQRTATQHS